MENQNAYDLKSVKLPYLAGGTLKLFASLVEGPLGGLLTPSLFESAGINWLRKQRYDENPTYLPLHDSGGLQKTESAVPEDEAPRAASRTKGFQFPSVFDFAEAYRAGRLTPEEVAQKVLDAIHASDAGDKPLRAFIAVEREDVMRQARESTKRIKTGKPLGIFDGVPVAVKDEMDMTPYPTTVGTSFLGKDPAREDAAVVARMRSAGALLVGKANMHEIGITQRLGKVMSGHFSPVDGRSTRRDGARIRHAWDPRPAIPRSARRRRAGFRRARPRTRGGRH